MADDHGRGSAGDPGHVVVLGHPVPPIAPRFGMLGEVPCIGQGGGGIAPFGDQREIKNRYRSHACPQGRALFVQAMPEKAGSPRMWWYNFNPVFR